MFPELICPICESNRTSMNDLHAHMEIIHKSSKFEYVCEICGKVSYSVQGYLTHHNKIHSLDKKAVYDLFCKSKSDGVCSVCSEETVWAPPKINKWGYNPLCSKHDRERRNIQRKETCIRRYGVTNPLHVDKIDEQERDIAKRSSTIRNSVNCAVVDTIGGVVISPIDSFRKVRNIILDNCFNSKGNLKTKQSNHIKNLIYKLTPFFPESVTLPYRIFAVLSLQTELHKCINCDSILIPRRTSNQTFCKSCTKNKKNS